MKHATIAAPAEDDLADIWFWIAADSPAMADRVIATIRQEVQLARRQPGGGEAPR